MGRRCRLLVRGTARHGALRAPLRAKPANRRLQAERAGRRPKARGIRKPAKRSRRDEPKAKLQQPDPKGSHRAIYFSSRCSYFFGSPREFPRAHHLPSSSTP